MSDPQPLRIVVDCRPDDRELAVIAAAVMAMSAASPEPVAKPGPNLWREANKRESLRTPIKENQS